MGFRAGRGEEGQWTGLGGGGVGRWARWGRELGKMIKLFGIERMYGFVFVILIHIDERN